MNTFILKMAWRETRAAWRHFFYFLTSIAVGVGALVGVSLFSAHLEQAVTKEARGLLGGDLEVRLSRQMSQQSLAWLTSLAGREITTTHVSELIGMAAHASGTKSDGQSSQIVELKAVDALYPFYGTLRVEPDRPLWDLLQLQPAGCPGQPCWGAVVQESLLIRMGLALGQSLTIGQATFRITGIVRTEPDRMANAFSLGPRVLIAQDGLRATELVKLGSRVRERYLLKTPAALAVEPLLYELRSRLAEESARVSTYKDAQPQLKQFLEQLTRYLGLIGLTALFVGGIGVATSVRAFLREKLVTIAILKAVGADSPTIIQTYAAQALFLGLAGSGAGLALGIGLEQAVPWMLSSWFASDMLGQIGFTSGPSLYSLLPLGKGLALGLLTTLLFTLWPLLAIRSVKPVALLRRNALTSEPSPGATGRTWRQRLDRTQLLTAGTIVVGLALLSMWQAGTWKIGLLFMGAFSLALALLGGIAWIVIRILAAVARPQQLAVRHAIGNIVRPGSQAVSMTIAIGIGVMVIITVALVERALLRQIGESRPVDAPTFFFIDIQPDQVDGISRLLRDRIAAHAPTLTPLVRSRLMAVNDQPIKTEAVSEEDERTAQAADKEQRRKAWYLTREYVLTFLDELPKDNVIVKGQWWTAGQTFSVPIVSVEEEAAKAMGLDIGDKIELDIQGTPLIAEVGSIRKVEWGNLSTNFYMVLSPGSLDGAPLTYVATVQVPPADEVPLQQAIVAGFPNVTAINIGDVLDSFARILDRLSLAIRTIALFCVLTGGLVMGAALAATRYRRLYESAVLKALGATRGLLIGSFALEYLLLGIVGGAIGVGLASALSWALLRWVFELDWALHPSVLLIGLGLTIGLTLLVGFLSTYRLLGQRPLPVLRYE
ncbi:MAG: FtsX-like permease family protein [Nitrospira sp.]|nr:MAG: FtsX-like permease family protein [Nitrospira sp.]